MLSNIKTIRRETLLDTARLPHILIVEDDDLQIHVIEQLIKQGGFTSTSVKDGHSALSKLSEEIFDLIISDVNMPHGISGFDLLNTVRADENLKHIPFIIVTGRRTQKDVEKAISSDVDDYITKPIDGTILLAKTESLLSARKKIHAFFEHPISFDGDYMLKLKIIGLSEQGIKYHSPLPMRENFKFRLESPIFSKIGISTPHVLFFLEWDFFHRFSVIG